MTNAYTLGYSLCKSAQQPQQFQQTVNPNEPSWAKNAPRRWGWQVAADRLSPPPTPGSVNDIPEAANFARGVWNAGRTGMNFLRGVPTAAGVAKGFTMAPGVGTLVNAGTEVADYIDAVPTPLRPFQGYFGMQPGYGVMPKETWDQYTSVGNPGDNVFGYRGKMWGPLQYAGASLNAHTTPIRSTINTATTVPSTAFRFTQEAMRDHAMRKQPVPPTFKGFKPPIKTTSQGGEFGMW